jgi:hypothetical protein
VAQKAYYGVFSDYGFKTNKQVTEIRKQETEARRQWLSFNNVVTPDKNGNAIDWSTASGKQVNDSFSNAVQTAASGAFLYKLLHDPETILKNPDINSIRQMSTEEIIKSLNDEGQAGMAHKA